MNNPNEAFYDPGVKMSEEEASEIFYKCDFRVAKVNDSDVHDTSHELLMPRLVTDPFRPTNFRNVVVPLQKQYYWFDLHRKTVILLANLPNRTIGGIVTQGALLTSEKMIPQTEVPWEAINYIYEPEKSKLQKQVGLLAPTHDPYETDFCDCPAGHRLYLDKDSDVYQEMDTTPLPILKTEEEKRMVERVISNLEID